MVGGDPDDPVFSTDCLIVLSAPLAPDEAGDTGAGRGTGLTGPGAVARLGITVYKVAISVNAEAKKIEITLTTQAPGD